MSPKLIYISYRLPKPKLTFSTLQETLASSYLPEELTFLLKAGLLLGFLFYFPSNLLTHFVKLANYPRTFNNSGTSGSTDLAVEHFLLSVNKDPRNVLQDMTTLKE